MSIEAFGLLLLTASLVAILARRFHFPYTVGLLVAGLGLAFMPFAPHVALSKELIFMVLLPPLIFEASLFLCWKQLKPLLPMVLTLASLGLVVSAVVTGLGMAYLLGWPVLAASIFGVLIAATDPVSVIATFKEAGLKGKLRVLVEAESLFNDGVAAVLFALVLAFATAKAPSPIALGLNAMLIIGGGLACGWLVAECVLFIMGKAEDHLVELTLTTLAAYGSFLLAEQFHCSGVLATLLAGLIIGNRGHLQEISEKGKESIEAFWEFAAFIANSLIFILIGIQEAKHLSLFVLWPSLATILLVLLGRVFAIYPIAALFSKSKHALAFSHQHVLVWGGLRGALGLALALGLPPQLPYRTHIISATFVVVAFSLVVQGLTMSPLLLRLELMQQKNS